MRRITVTIETEGKMHQFVMSKCGTMRQDTTASLAAGKLRMILEQYPKDFERRKNDE